MILQALLVSKDDPTAETLIQVLAQFGIAVVRLSAADVAVSRLTDERFDQLIVDFEDPETASLMLETCRRLAGPDRNSPVTVALLTDPAQIRSILGIGAHFILTKPVNQPQAVATLRAATAILKRERRQSLRIAVQAPVSLRPPEDGTAIEGILLDLSTGGMEVLAAKPIARGSLVRTMFELPEADLRVEADAEVAWSTPNGQTGLRFLDMDANMRAEMSEWLTARSRDALPDEPAASQCKLTDLSLGGCYVETDSPFPQSSAVDLCLKAPGLEIHTEGLVRVMHPGHGMGIEFPARTEEQRKSVGEFIEFLTSQPGTEPQLETSPRALLASAADLSQTHETDSEDSLLELLRTGSSLEQESFLAELARQRTPADVSQ